MSKLGNESLRLAIWVVVGIAAFNWALVEFGDFDLLVDGVGLSGSNLTVAYGFIGAAAAVNLYNVVGYDVGILD